MHLCRYKTDALAIGAKQKALRLSRRLVQSAKIRNRRPFHPGFFEREDKDVTMADPGLHAYLEQGYTGDGVMPLWMAETAAKPTLPPVKVQRLAEFEPELADVPLEYARDALASMGTRLMGVFDICRVDPPQYAVDTVDINLIITDEGLSCLPTHALAIHPPADLQTSSPSDRANQLDRRGREVIILPIHAVLLAAHCGRLPEMPTSHPRPPPTRITLADGDIVNGYRVPFVPFCLPCPHAFEPLVLYMYTHNEDKLLDTLLPVKEGSDDEAEHHPLHLRFREGKPRKQVVERASADCVEYFRYKPLKIYQQARFIEGFRKNAVAIAVSDDRVWDMLQIVWEVLAIVMRRMTRIFETSGEAGFTLPGSDSKTANKGGGTQIWQQLEEGLKQYCRLPAIVT